MILLYITVFSDDKVIVVEIFQIVAKISSNMLTYSAICKHILAYTFTEQITF